jgi:hypothetical protein
MVGENSFKIVAINKGSINPATPTMITMDKSSIMINLTIITTRISLIILRMIKGLFTSRKTRIKRRTSKKQLK